MKIKFQYVKSTKTCARFEDGDRLPLYLKLEQLRAAGIKPEEGVTIEVKQNDDC